MPAQNNLLHSGKSRRADCGWADPSRGRNAAVGYAGVTGAGSTELGRRPIAPAWFVAIRVLLLLLAASVVGAVLWGGLMHEGRIISRTARPDAAHPGAEVHHGLSSLPLAAQGVVSEALGRESGAYRVSMLGPGYRAVNPAQGLRARFERSGVRVQSGGVQFGLHLNAVGYAGSLAPVAPVVPQARGNRVVYAHTGLSEWYANGPLGLEQGFTLARAPRGDATGPLTLSLALSGNTRVSVEADKHSLALASSGGASLLYNNLQAIDARGHALHSWITLQGGRVMLRVDARHAHYPLRIDPVVQQGDTMAQQGSKLTGKEETGEGWFGFSVALSSNGNIALVGGPGDNKFAGAAWVFTRSEGKWTQQAKLTGGEETGAGEFGTLVALSSSGATAVIGGPTDNKNAGAAWVFTNSEGKWTQQAKLTGGEETGAGEFGYGLAVSSEGNTAVIGGPADNKKAGAVWVFTRSEGIWTQQGKKITGEEETGEGEFGWKVALSPEGNTALIGGPTDNKNVGAVWIFTRSGGKWAQQGKKITGSEETSEGSFGYSVALSSEGNTALIGGPTDNKNVGAVWVFTSSGGKWTQQGKKITGSEETGEGYFGYGVALSSNGNMALIGGTFDHESVGSAWVFTSSEGKWTQQGKKITGKEETGEGRFGFRVALSSSGNTALIGGYEDNKGVGAAWAFTTSTRLIGKEETGDGEFGHSVALSSNGNTALIGGQSDNKFAGAAWVFTRAEGKWTQQAKITGGEEKGTGEFGFSVALSSEGNTALIGGPTDNSNAGAVWAFTRSEGKWTQQAKITGGEEKGAGYFGTSVALSSEGNTALIGGPDDNSLLGAAWVFTSSGGKWTQQGAKLTGKEEAERALFGESVALSSNGSTALVGGASDNENVGAAWVFIRSEGKWTQQGSKLTGKEETGKGGFGFSVALSSEGSTALIGGPADNSNAGAAWAFTSSEGKWTQQGSKLTGKEETSAGEFGFSVALSSEGSTALIGVPGDSGGLGSARVLTRAEGKWTQQAGKLAGIEERNEESMEGVFGWSVALSSEANTALIGGPGNNATPGEAWAFTA